MRSSLRTFITVFLLSSLLLIACGPTTVNQLVKDKNAKQLAPGEVLLAAKNNTLFLQGPKVSTYIYFDESGYAYGLDIYNNKDIGRWDVSDKGELCFKMNFWWYSQMLCHPVYHDSNKYYLVNNSEVLMFTADHFKGDSKKLYYDAGKGRRKFLMAQSNKKSPRPEVKSTSTTDKPTISEETTSPTGPSDEELKSTVKWMAKDCPDCNLSGTNLSGADLVGAQLQGANLTGADLSKANLRRANLKEANLHSADLSYANMPGADLRESDLSDAVFKGTNLIRANFTGANTEGANFEGALLEGAEGLQ